MLTRRSALTLPFAGRLLASPRAAQSVFRLEDRLPPDYQGFAVTHAMEVTPHGLWFLISPPRTLNPPQALLLTDFDGTRKAFAPLPKQVEPHGLQVDSAGNVYAWKVFLSPNVSRSEIYQLSPQLELTRSTSVEEQIIGIVLNNDRLMRIGKSAITDVRSGETAVPFDTSAFGYGSACTTSSGKAMFQMQGPQPQVTLVDFAAAQVRTMRLEAPELGKGGRPFLDAALGSDEQIAVVASRQKAALGALVLRFNLDGELLTRTRYALPQRTEDAIADNPEGFLFPGLIRRYNNLLYLADRAGQVCRYAS